MFFFAFLSGSPARRAAARSSRSPAACRCRVALGRPKTTSPLVLVLRETAARWPRGRSVSQSVITTLLPTEHMVHYPLPYLVANSPPKRSRRMLAHTPADGRRRRCAQSSARTTHACREPLGACLGPPSRALGRRTEPSSRLSNGGFATNSPGHVSEVSAETSTPSRHRCHLPHRCSR